MENPFKKRINKRTKIRRVRRGGEDTIFRLSDCNSSFTASPLILLQKEKYILLSSISVYRSERERETADGGVPFFCRHHFFYVPTFPPLPFYAGGDAVWVGLRKHFLCASRSPPILSDPTGLPVTLRSTGRSREGKSVSRCNGERKK